MADSDNESGDNGSSGSERDRFLPIANVSRIMKKALPANAKITKEAKETVQMCASEFISFITGEASDKCLNEKRKTINGDDLLEVMSILGFDNYIGPLKLYLNKFRELKGDNQGIGTSAAGGGGSASSSSSQPTDVLGGGGNVGGSYGADLYGTGIGGAGSGMMVMGQQLYGADLYGTGIGGSGSGGSGMMVMGQQLYGVAGGGGSTSSSSSQPTNVLWGGGNVGGSYGADLYGTGIGGAGSGGMVVMGQQFYGGSPKSGSLDQHQQHQLGSGLFRGSSGGGSGGGFDGSSSPSGRQARKDVI